MLKLIGLFTLLNLTLTGYSALAEEVTILETCHVESSLELQGPTQIFCADDLSFEDGVEIVTQGHGLQIVALGRIQFGKSSQGLQITSVTGPAGQIFIYARTASGNLNIQNQGQPADSFGGDVEIEYGSSFNYTQSIEPGNAADVRMVVAGQQLQLEGSQHKLPL